MAIEDIDNWRFDPFTGTVQPRTLTETHTIKLWQNFGNRYGIQTNQGILNENPSSVSIPGYLEVSKATSPSSNQFRVDYDPLRQDGTVIQTIKYYNTGFIEFNASQDTQTVTITYKATGLIVSGRNFAAYLANETIPGNLNVTGNFGTTGNTTVGGTLGAGATTLASLGVTGNLNAGTYSEINLNNNKAINVATGTATTDAVNKGQMDTAISASVSPIRPASGVSTDPAVNAFVYRLVTSGSTLNITGIPNNDGVVFFIDCTNTSSISDTFISIHGTSLLTIAPLQRRSALAYRTGGVWYAI